MMRTISMIAAAALLSTALVGNAHGAVSTVPTAGVAAASMAAGTGVVGTGGGVVIVGVNKGGWSGFFGGVAGLLIAAGGTGIIVLDPPQATYYNGAFTVHYDSSLLNIVEDFGTGTQVGWLGDWGANGSPTLPVNPDDWGADGSFEVELQPPAAGLTSTVVNDAANGMLTVTFDWGPAGHIVPDAGPFNFYGAVFEAQKHIRVDFLGSAFAAPAAALLPGANMFVTTSGFNCTLPDETLIRVCGDELTQFFKVSEIPEPATWAMMIAGFGLIGGMLRRRAPAAAIAWNGSTFREAKKDASGGQEQKW